MPKQTFKIEGFHGGINSNSDPRDIRPNEDLLFTITLFPLTTLEQNVDQNLYRN